MPETAVNENHNMVFRQYDVRLPKQSLPGREAKSKAHSMECGANRPLRLGVATTNRLHVAAPLLFRQYVTHVAAAGCA